MVSYSRWGRSTVETEQDIALELEAISSWANVLSERANADIVVVHSKVPFGPDEHRLAPDLKLLITTTSGTDHIDLEYFRRKGIPVARLPLARRDAVVDTTIGMLIWGMRRMGVLNEAARQGRWARGQLPEIVPIGLRGSRIGIVGFGVIGNQVCSVLEALGVTIWGCDPVGIPEGVRGASIQEMVGHCDAITLHCSLGPGSSNLVSSEVLAHAHPDLVIVNTARGGVLDLNTAMRMVEAGELGALAVDVFPQEPWLHMSQVLECPNVMLHPHAAGYHKNLARSIREGLSDVVQSYIDGRPMKYVV